MNYGKIMVGIDLKEDDLVIDVGGYTGSLVGYLLSIYKCQMIVFEPNPAAYKVLCDKFKENVSVIMKAVGYQTGVKKLYINGPSTSLSKEWAGSEKFVEVDTIKLSEFIKDRDYSLVMNCEGAEFGIIKDLYESKSMGRIKNILVQFHGESSIDVHTILSITHELHYRYTSWQLWVKKHG